MKSFKSIAVFAIAPACILLAACGDDTTPGNDAGDDVIAGDSLGEQDALRGDVNLDRDAAGDSTGDAADTVETPTAVRFVFFSDLHFRAVDGDEKHNRDVGDLVTMINALTGDFDMVISGGDNYDHILPQWEADPINSPMSWYVEEMDKLKFPWIAAIGNHEFYDFFGDIPTMTDDGVSRRQAFSTVMGRPLYYTTEVNGVKLIVMDSAEEGAWGETQGLMGKFSAAQLDWLRTELAAGKPAFLFFHHPPSSFAPVNPAGQLCDVLSEYPGVVKGIFAGHTHGFWKGEYCETPYWVVEDYHNDVNLWYEVEYDIPNDTVTILNADSIKFPEVPEFTCTPGESTVTAPETAVGTLQRMNVLEGISDASGLGEMLGEMMGAIPFVFSFDSWDAESGYDTRLTIASRWEVDGFLTYVDGSPCLDLPLRFKGGSPCFEAGPVSMNVQILPFLASVSDDPVNPEWSAILDIRNMILEGRIGNAEDGTPIIADGVVTATIIRDPTLKGLKKILVDEYCAGRADGCATPGEGTLPVCPAELDEAGIETVYTGIYGKCDFQIMGFGMTMIIDMVATLPDETHVTGKIVSEKLTVSPAIEGGGQVTDTLFLTDAGKNCASE